MDFYSITLASLGVEIEGESLGLGTNLFSGEQTLAEKYGYGYLFEELEKNHFSMIMNYCIHRNDSNIGLSL